MIARSILAIAAMTGGLAHCAPPDDSAPAPIGRTIYISESITRFNADSGDYVIMIMDQFDDAAIERCDNSGGEPIYDPVTDILECDGIDF